MEPGTAQHLRSGHASGAVSWTTPGRVMHNPPRLSPTDQVQHLSPTPQVDRSQRCREDGAMGQENKRAPCGRKSDVATCSRTQSKGGICTK